MAAIGGMHVYSIDGFDGEQYFLRKGDAIAAANDLSQNEGATITVRRYQTKRNMFENLVLALNDEEWFVSEETIGVSERGLYTNYERMGR